MTAIRSNFSKFLSNLDSGRRTRRREWAADFRIMPRSITRMRSALAY